MMLLRALYERGGRHYALLKSAISMNRYEKRHNYVGQTISCFNALETASSSA